MDELLSGWRNLAEALSLTSADIRLVPTPATDPGIICFTSATIGSPKRLLHAQARYGLGHEATAETQHALQDHCKQPVAPYKYPREIEFVAELPKTVSGRTRRFELRRKQAAAGVTPSAF